MSSSEKDDLSLCGICKVCSFFSSFSSSFFSSFLPSSSLAKLMAFLFTSGGELDLPILVSTECESIMLSSSLILFRNVYWVLKALSPTEGLYAGLLENYLPLLLSWSTDSVLGILPSKPNSLDWFMKRKFLPRLPPSTPTTTDICLSLWNGT